MIGYGAVMELFLSLTFFWQLVIFSNSYIQVSNTFTPLKVHIET